MNRDRFIDAAMGGAFAAQIVGACVLTLAGGAVLLPGGRDAGINCLSRAWLDVECPMCGMTRSFVAFAHGDVAGAFAAHPAGPVLFAFTGLVALAVAAAWLRSARPISARAGFRRALAAVAVACAAMGAGRHLV